MKDSFQIEAWRNDSGIIEKLIVDGVELDTSDIVEFKISVGDIANISVLLSEFDDLSENVLDTNGRIPALSDTRDWVDGILAAVAESESEEEDNGKIIPFPYLED